MFQILHLADLHLGWAAQFLGPRADERRAERNRLLDRAVDFALRPESRIGLVILAGDLFETHRPDAALTSQVIGQLKRLEAAGVRTVTVPGNHDEITYHDSVYRQKSAEWPGVLVQNPSPAHVVTLDVGGTPVHVYSLAYTGGLTRTSPPIDFFPRLGKAGKHIGVFHGSLDWDAGDRSLPLSSAALGAAGYDYIALGHIHQHLVRDVGKSRAVYPGAVEGKGFSDPGTGFFIVIEMGESAVVRQVPAGTRPVRAQTLDAGTFASQEELAVAVASLGDGQAIQQVALTGSPAFPIDIETLRARVEGAFYFLDLSDETEFLSPPMLERLVQEPTIRGQFAVRMRRALEAAADERERRILERALRFGLSGFSGGAAR